MKVILTGEINSGKTSYLKELVAQSNAYAGILSVKKFENERFEGYDLFDVDSKSTHEFIRLSLASESITKRFVFDQKMFRYADKLIKKGIDQGKTIIIDEVGPLELSGGGFDCTLRQCLESGFSYLIVVRRGLVDAVIQRYELKGVEIMEI